MQKYSVYFDDYDVAGFARVAAGFGQSRFSFAVTPNVDHLIRLRDDAVFRSLYAEAAFVLLDSRFLSNLLQLTRGLHLPVCTGSDLTAHLFSRVINAEDRIVLIGGNAEQAGRLSRLYGLKQLCHYNPPMGFIHDAAAVEATLQFVEAHSPFRFCFLAVGAPQQEMLAQQLKDRDVARGLALCVGASINFLTGIERRAPLWMQRIGMECLYRLALAPHRMAHRYLVRCPRIFGFLRHVLITLRPAAHLPANPAPVPALLTLGLGAK